MTSQTWQDFCGQIFMAGFQIIQQKSFMQGGTQRAHIIAACPDPFLLLNASSFRYKPHDEESLNDATVYGFIDISGLAGDELMHLLHCSSENPSRSPIACAYHIGPWSATIEKIIAIRRLGRFVAWPRKHVYASVECHQVGEDAHQAWRQFYATAPDWVVSSLWL